MITLYFTNKDDASIYIKAQKMKEFCLVDKMRSERILLFFLSSPVIHAQCLQPHLSAQPHHNVCHSAATHLLHGSHEQHPGVLY